MKLTLTTILLITIYCCLVNSLRHNHQRNLRLRKLVDLNRSGLQNGPTFRRQANFIVTEIPGIGKIKGRRSATAWSGTDIYQFFDIKYGHTTSGKRRFKAPLPAQPWKNVRRCIIPRQGCPSLQDMSFIRRADGKRDLEDCLSLSVHTRSLQGKSPVMVYLHGEFLYEGTPEEAAPQYLLEKDVLLVNVRYRLGPFGFLSTMSDRIPGNAAVMDVILALEWIQKYIYVFGGDPNRVTVFGQVGGAAIANVLTMSPLVRNGLFHRVIYQSGSALTPAFVTDTPTGFSKDIAKHAGCKDLDTIQKLNRCFVRMNVTTLLESFSSHGMANAEKGIGYYGGVQFTVGGPSGVLPNHPGKLISDKKIRYYPTMGGVVKNPGTFLLRELFEDNFNETIPDDVYDAKGYMNFIIAHTNGDDTNKAWTTFAEKEFFTKEEMKNGTFAMLLPGLIDMCGTIPFKNPVLLALQANAEKLPNSTFLYSFNYEGEFNRYQREDDDGSHLPFDFGVSLTDENLYLFPWPKYASFLNYRDNRIAKKMIDLWTSFATNGIPTSDRILEWPPLTANVGPYLKIDRVSKIEKNFLNEYSITVKEYRMGLSLISEEYFENIEDVNTEDDLKKDIMQLNLNNNNNNNNKQQIGEIDEDYDYDDANELGKFHNLDKEPVHIVIATSKLE